MLAFGKVYVGILQESKQIDKGYIVRYSVVWFSKWLL
jgi:hypothetical protein